MPESEPKNAKDPKWGTLRFVGGDGSAALGPPAPRGRRASDRQDVGNAGRAGAKPGQAPIQRACYAAARSIPLAFSPRRRVRVSSKRLARHPCHDNVQPNPPARPSWPSVRPARATNARAIRAHPTSYGREVNCHSRNQKTQKAPNGALCVLLVETARPLAGLLPFAAGARSARQFNAPATQPLVQFPWRFRQIQKSPFRGCFVFGGDGGNKFWR